MIKPLLSCITFCGTLVDDSSSTKVAYFGFLAKVNLKFKIKFSAKYLLKESWEMGFLSSVTVRVSVKKIPRLSRARREIQSLQ